MTNLERIQNMSKEELVKFLMANGRAYDTIWDMSFEDSYCGKCEEGYCEDHKYCKFFPGHDLDDEEGDIKFRIELWLDADKPLPALNGELRTCRECPLNNIMNPDQPCEHCCESCAEYRGTK